MEKLVSQKLLSKLLRGGDNFFSSSHLPVATIGKPFNNLGALLSPKKLSKRDGRFLLRIVLKCCNPAKLSHQNTHKMLFQSWSWVFTGRRIHVGWGKAPIRRSHFSNEWQKSVMKCLTVWISIPLKAKGPSNFLQDFLHRQEFWKNLARFQEKSLSFKILAKNVNLARCCTKSAFACKIVLQDLVRNKLWVV